MYENMYEKMIAVTNRHLVLENDTDGAYLKQLTYVASLHPKAMVLREKDLTEESTKNWQRWLLSCVRRRELPLFCTVFQRWYIIWDMISCICLWKCLKL